MWNILIGMKMYTVYYLNHNKNILILQKEIIINYF
jgi:hypothetical protein